MSAPFVNPYETKDVVATTLTNLDKQTQDLISYLDGFFSSEVTKDRELILDTGVVEVLKPFEVATSSGAFWDKGTTYYFQPIAERLREISQEIQAKIYSTDVTQNLRDGIEKLFSEILDDSRTQVVNPTNTTNPTASNWRYEVWYASNSADHPARKFDTTADINSFFNAVKTGSFSLADAASDENITTQAMANGAAGLKIDVKLDGIAGLLDDGDNYYNDSPITDDPLTAVNESVSRLTKQDEFYLMGNKRVPVFGKFETKPTIPPTDPLYDQQYYNFINQRIDPTNVYWNNPLAPKTNEEIFLGLMAIVLTAPKYVAPVIPRTDSEINASAANIALETGLTEAAVKDALKNWNDPAYQASVELIQVHLVRSANEQMMNQALNALEDQTYNYLINSQAWYNLTPPRNMDAAVSPAPPSFLLSKMNTGTIDYSNYDGNYGVFNPSSGDNQASLIASGTGLTAAEVTDALNNWNGTANPDHIKIITSYYVQSYINASITSTFAQKDKSLSTKNFFLHSILSEKDPGSNPYLTSSKVLRFDSVLNDVPSGYLRGLTNPGATTVPGVSQQMMQLMDMFLEHFDIGASRYVEDKRTLVDLFTGKLVSAANDNKQLSNILFQNISDAAGDIAAQSKNILLRGVADAVENQFMLDLFNQTALRKEDYGLSPNPADLTKTFLPSYWVDKKEKFFPAHYYFDTAAYNPNPPPATTDPSYPAYLEYIAKFGSNPGFHPNSTDPSYADKVNHAFDPTKNGLPAGFPIMDLRDFNEFFKAIKNELNNLLGAGYITGYPTWSDTGFTSTVAEVFGSMANRDDLSRVVLLHDSLSTILDNLEDRVDGVSGDIPKIPRPQSVTVNKPISIDAAGNVITAPEPITLNSSIAGYGDQASLKLVTHFLQMHRDTSGIEDPSRPAADKINDQISYLINMFDDYSKFSQNSAFETVYPGQVFEADKHNYTILNAKKPEPGPDGSMPEDKGVPKPLMSALSSSAIIGQVGQIITSKVNNIVESNDILSVKNVSRSAGATGAIDITNTTLSGSIETQTYLQNILKQIADISATGALSVDISAIGSEISTRVETGVKSLITATDNNNYRMVFIDDETITGLNNFLTTLNSFNPTGALGDLKTRLTNADLTGGSNSLMSLAYPAGSSAPGYVHYNALSPAQQALINDIKNGTLTTATIQAAIPPNTVPVKILDTTLNTLGNLVSDVTAAFTAAALEKPPRDVNLAADPVLNAIKAARIDFNSLTANDPGSDVDYNIIMNAEVFDPVAVPLAPHTVSLAGHPNETIIRNARSTLLAGLLANANKNIAGVPLNNLSTGNTANPYLHLFSPKKYDGTMAAVPDIRPSGFPSTLGGMTTATAFRTQLGNVETYLTDLNTALNSAINERPPRDIDINNDPILKLAQLADLDFTDLTAVANPIWGGAYNSTSVFNAILLSDKAAGGPLVLPADQAIRNARAELLNFFLNNGNISDPVEGDFKLTQINGTATGHVRYRNLIAPLTHAYPNTSSLDDNTGNTAALSFGGIVDISKADSYTLREILGADVDMDDGVQTGNVPNSLEDLESRMRSGEFNEPNRRLYIRKMQHFNILFNTLSGGTPANKPLKSFLEKIPPGTTINEDTYNHTRLSFDSLNPTDPTDPKTLGEYIEAIAADPNIINSPDFQNIVNQVGVLAPIINNINALEVTLASDLKKPKAGPESSVYSTLHLLTQIENQLTDKDMALGLLQILNTRQIQKEGVGIQDLEQRPVTKINLKQGEYQFHGYAANIHFLRPTNVPSISGNGLPPDQTQRWNLEQAILNKGASLPSSLVIGGFLDGDSDIDAQDFTNLGDIREFLVAANEVYKDMKSSKSKVIREQAVEFDLWLKNNSISRIADAALTGKDGLEADVNLLDHILLGAANGTAADINTVGIPEIRAFMDSSKNAATNNRIRLENLDALRVASKGLSQRIDDALPAQELRKYFQENLYYPANASFAAIPGDTRTDFTKDHFGRDLNNSNLPILGVNIFGIDYPVPVPAPIPAPRASNSHQLFNLNATNTIDPYQQMFNNVEAILERLEATERALNPIPLPPPSAADSKKLNSAVTMYKIMLQNLLGESSSALTSSLVAEANSAAGLVTPNAAGVSVLVPSDSSLSGGGLTYTDNYPSTTLKTNILSVRQDIADEIDPQKFTGTPNGANLANFTLAKVANTQTYIRDVGIEGKSIQELVVLMYVLQMFEQSNWAWEKYINDTSRYEVESAV